MRHGCRKAVVASVIGCLAVFFVLSSDRADESPPSARSPERFFSLDRTDFQSRFSGAFGYRSDDLNWNIAGDLTGNNPNILSELEWEDLSIFQVKLANTTVYRGIYLKGALAYGWIYSGDVQDSDYLDDDRSIEYSRTNNAADDGNTLDASVAVGYRFLFQSGFIGISPMVGYSYHQQNLTMTDGNQTVESIFTPPSGPFDGLDSSYDTEWKGPWVGLDLSFQSPAGTRPKPTEGYELTFGVEYHWADYDAEGDWNLRTDFAHPKSFEHQADGSGIVVSTEFNFFFNPRWALHFSANYQTWETDPGTDRTFYADGTISEARLNEVNWTTYALMLGIVYSLP